jgi:RNA polymerase sigma-70 factor (ECF subfamily)
MSAGTPARRSSQGNVSPGLLEACRRGDRDAFRALYEAHKDRVYSIAFYFFHADADAAAEVTQHVFLKLMREIGRFRGDAAFTTWLYRLVINACVDRSRARREVAASVQHAIASLPVKLRTAILLRYFEDLSYADMASALNCSIGTVASRLSRGHRLLARTLGPIRASMR